MVAQPRRQMDEKRRSNRLSEIKAHLLQITKTCGSAWQARRSSVLGRRTGAGRLYSGVTATERVKRQRAIRVTRVRGGVLRARDGSTQRCLRRRQIRLKKSQDGALESRCAAALSIFARGGRGRAVGRWRAVCGHRRIHRPQPEGQVHGSRRHHRQEHVVGRQPVDHRRAVLRALCRLPQACRRHDAVRAGSLRRRRSELPDQDARLHRTRLALAVHPHAADPPRGLGARAISCRS